MKYKKKPWKQIRPHKRKPQQGGAFYYSRKISFGSPGMMYSSVTGKLDKTAKNNTKKRKTMKNK